MDLFDYVGHQIALAPSLTGDVVIAAIVTDPDNAHYVAHSVAFNAPSVASSTVASIFTYAQITDPQPYGLPTLPSPSGAFAGTKTFAGQLGAIIDQPAAAAAITAGLTTGILEANLSPADTQTDLSSVVAQAVIASLAQNATFLKGPVAGHVFNYTGNSTGSGGADTTKGFQQSNGTSGGSTTQQTLGMAGAITGYIAEVTNVGDTTISAITKAVLTAAVGGNAKPYALQIAQAAGQAFAWVAYPLQNAPTTIAQVVGNPIFDIAAAVFAAAGGNSFSLTQVQFAVQFGISQANAGVIGAGALGLNATGLNGGILLIKAQGNQNADYYIQRSAAGTPVTDIFSL